MTTTTKKVELAVREADGAWEHVGDYGSIARAIEAARDWAPHAWRDDSGTAVFGITEDSDSGHYETLFEIREDGSEHVPRPGDLRPMSDPTKHEAGVMTLLDYANDRENVVLFWAGVGRPAGEHDVLGHPDMDFADRNGLLDLTGTVDESGDWQWDGEGDRTDDMLNTIYKVQAYVDANKWASLVEEYESGD